MPFWKKTDKGGKKKPPKPAVPRTAQQSIPMQRMFEDGTCRVKPNYYTRTIQYQDINYQLAQQEDKTAIFEEWCSFLNFFDSSIKFELSFVNMATDSTEFEKSIRIPYQRDGFDDVRAEYYLLPNLTLPQQEKALGKYGRLRRTYLMKHRPVLYNSMLLSGTLHPHLLEVEQSAESRIQQTMQKLLEQNPAPNKEQHQMEWVQHMNSLNAQAEELVMNELIYS